MEIAEVGLQLKNAIERFKLLGEDLFRRQINCDPFSTTQIIGLEDDAAVAEAVLPRIPGLVLTTAIQGKSNTAVCKSRTREFRNPSDPEYEQALIDWMGSEAVRMIIFACLAADLQVRTFYIYDCIDESSWFEVRIYWD